MVSMQKTETQIKKNRMNCRDNMTAISIFYFLAMAMLFLEKIATLLRWVQVMPF